MAYLDKIKVNNTNVDVHDSRVTSIDTTPTENSTNLITSGGVYSVLGDIQSALDAILGSGVTLITFTIAGDTYQAEDGMTWGDWINSSYNTGGFHVYDGYDNFITDRNSNFGMTLNKNFQYPQTTLVNNASYALSIIE